MKIGPPRPFLHQTIDVRAMAASICQIQKPDGEIPWSAGGKTDPWDHVESAMGLAVAGCFPQARLAYEWSAEIQNPDGSFFAAYRNGRVEEKRRDPNMSAYLAVGVWHYHLVCGGDASFLRRMWPCVSRAVDFAVSLQSAQGPVWWSMGSGGEVECRALLTGSSSIYLSLRCALSIAARLGKSRPKWEFALRKLGQAIRGREDLFDASKARYSMDWYYPILCGAVTGPRALARIEARWNDFVVENWGVKCVADRPWVTMAESAECVLALAAAGCWHKARRIFSWIRNCRFSDGQYWTGCTYPDSVVWPEERTAWTTAAVLLAADAVHAWTPGSAVFSHAFWENQRTRLRLGKMSAA